MPGGSPLGVTTENAEAVRLRGKMLKVTIQEEDDSAGKLGPGKLLRAG